VIVIEREPCHEGMYRLRYEDGTLSDMATLTRCKEAAARLAGESRDRGKAPAEGEAE